MSRIEASVVSRGARDHQISRMTEHDLLEVVEIEEACGLSRWGWDAYHSELTSENAALMFVARQRSEETSLSGGKLKGFIAARLIADELHINNVAVRQEYRGGGIGRSLLESVLTEGQKKGARSAFLEVRAGNRPAQALYEGSGFRASGLRKDYYSEPLEDAIVMSRALLRSA